MGSCWAEVGKTNKKPVTAVLFFDVLQSNKSYELHLVIGYDMLDQKV